MNSFDAPLVTGLLHDGVRPGFVRRLLAEFASPDAWRASPLLPDEDPRWRSLPPVDPLTGAVVYGSRDYPWALGASRFPPPAVYFEGDSTLLIPAVSLTGGRTVSSLGKVLAEEVVAFAGSVGAAVVSGGDVGVEEFFVRTAIRSGVRVVLVTGCGSRSRPGRVECLAAAVLDGGGTVVSSFPPHQKESSFSLDARRSTLGAFSAALVVADGPVPGPAARLVRHAADVNVPLLAALPPPRLRDDPGVTLAAMLTGCRDASALLAEAPPGRTFPANATITARGDVGDFLTVLWAFRPVDTASAQRRNYGVTSRGPR